MKHIFCLGAILIAVVATSVIGGCESQGGLSPKVQDARVERAKEFRGYFDKAKGDYSQLDPGDRAAFVKLAGGDEKAQRFWNMMKFGPSSGQKK